MIKESGFTLLEMLLVLSILSIILLLGVPIFLTSLEKQEEKHFLETFEMDVLYIQSHASTAPSETIMIRFFQDNYGVYMGPSRLFKRTFPSEWDVNTNIIKNVSFFPNGLIRKPGTMTITTKKSKYDIIFPLGKGRGYIVEK